MSHANPSGDLAVVLERALDVLILQFEKRRFGASEARPAKRLGYERGEARKATLQADRVAGRTTPP